MYNEDRQTQGKKNNKYRGGTSDVFIGTHYDIDHIVIHKLLVFFLVRKNHATGGRMDGRTEELTDEPTDSRTDDLL